mgnify:CR=1 FL=1
MACPPHPTSLGATWQVRHPDLWDQRFELDALVDSYRRARLPSGQHALDEVQAAERMGLPLNQVRHLAVSPYISHHLPSSIIASHHLPSPPITSLAIFIGLCLLPGFYPSIALP